MAEALFGQKKTKNKRQQIKNGTVNSQNSGRSLLDSLNLQSQSGAACVWSWWLYAAADCWERATGDGLRGSRCGENNGKKQSPG